MLARFRIALLLGTAWASFSCALVCLAGDVEADKTAPEKKASDTSPATLGDSELLIFEDMPVVVSASRQEAKLGLTSVPVSVISHKDIHYGGLTKLPELFQFVPGVDVLAIDRNRYEVGVRGLHEYYSDRTLTLINGRSAESARYGGPEFLRYPVMMEDIERIEVVRGPGGAAWGANAFNGVINIITKKPEDTQGILATSTVNHFGDTYSHIRWGAKNGNWAWRTSYGYQEHESSEDAISDSEFDSKDFRKAGTFDGEAAYSLSPATRIAFGAGYQFSHMGPFETTRARPKDSDQLHTARAFARADHEFNADMAGYAQWFGNFTDDYEPWLMRSDTSQNDLEGQLSFKVAGNHQLTAGCNLRWTYMDIEKMHPANFTFKGEPFNEYQVGAFILDRWQINQRLIFEGQVRGDWYSGTHADWSTRLATLVGLDDRVRHVLRFSGARSFRAPQVGLRNILSSRSRGGVSTNFLPADDLGNEGITSFEAGYNGQLTKQISLRLDGYYQIYDELVGMKNWTVTRFAPGAFAPTTDINLTPEHIDGAEAYGGEAELSVTGQIGKLSLWFAYNDFLPNREQQPIRAFLPAKHKAGITGRLFLPHQVTLNGQYRYSDLTRSTLVRYSSTQSYHRLDFTVSKMFAGERAELLFGVRDVLDDTSFSTLPLSSSRGHDVPGRVFFARLQLKF